MRRGWEGGGRQGEGRGGVAEEGWYHEGKRGRAGKEGKRGEVKGRDGR